MSSIAFTTPQRRPAPSPRDARDIDALLRRWRDHRDECARDALVAHFTPLAQRLARRYNSAHEPFEDLVQVALVGLIGAVDRFDPDRDVPFHAFAIPTILGELKRYFRSSGWSVHVPRGVQELSLRVDRAAREIARETGRSPTPTQISQRLEISLDDVLTALEATTAHYATSLDAPARGSDDEDDARTVRDCLGVDEDGFALTETKLSLAVALERLPYLERRALRLRIDHGLKQSEIARVIGCSQMQVSRLLRRAAARVDEMTNPELAIGRR